MISQVVKLRNVPLDVVLSEMRRMTEEGSVDPDVMALALYSVEFSPYYVSSIFDFVQKTFPYLPDNLQPDASAYDEYLTHPRLMAQDYFRGFSRAEDCDGFAMLTCAMCRTQGMKSHVVVADCNFDGYLDHAYAEVWREELGWISMDTSTKWLPLGWTIPSRFSIVL